MREGIYKIPTFSVVSRPAWWALTARTDNAIQPKGTKKRRMKNQKVVDIPAGQYPTRRNFFFLKRKKSGQGCCAVRNVIHWTCRDFGLLFSMENTKSRRDRSASREPSSSALIGCTVRVARVNYNGDRTWENRTSHDGSADPVHCVPVDAFARHWNETEYSSGQQQNGEIIRDRLLTFADPAKPLARNKWK